MTTKIQKEIKKRLISGKSKTCSELNDASNAIAAMIGADDANHFEEGSDHACPCGDGSSGGSESGLVDFVILVDSSGSMRTASAAIEESLDISLKKAEESCGITPKVTLLYVGSSSALSSSIFVQSHESYLMTQSQSPALTDFYSRRSDAPLSSGNQREEGAEAMMDIIKYNDWRPGACRAIMYFSDEWLDGSSNPDDAAIRAKERAQELISMANSSEVTLFAHHLPASGGSQGNSGDPDSVQLYKDITEQTNGEAIIGGDPSAELYEKIITKAICNSCANSGGCKTADLPTYEPCVHVSWGASKCDGIESHDDEVITISICNCYSNMSFSNVSLAYAVVVDEKGNLPPLLPDGTPSAMIYPIGPICFGDVGPCVDGEEGCVSRQFVLLTRGVEAGQYTLKLGGLCYDINSHIQIESVHHFKICKD